MPSTTAPIGFGPLLRQWRTARRMSQQQLAIESEVSTRHISYVENGKSSPSREMVLILASALDLPLRERNSLLSSAGFAPVYRETDLSEPVMGPVRHAFDTILSHHEPYPAIVLNRGWDVVKMNDAFMRMFAFFLEPPFDPIVGQNVMHSLFHPQGVRPYVGAGATLGLDYKNPPNANDDLDLRCTVRLVGGSSWVLKSRKEFFLEGSMILGALHNWQFMAGWRF